MDRELLYGRSKVHNIIVSGKELFFRNYLFQCLESHQPIDQTLLAGGF